MAPFARREISSLRVLCLRSIGPLNCDTETTFAPKKLEQECENEDANFSSATKLLLALTKRPVYIPGTNHDPPNQNDVSFIPIPRLEYGSGQTSNRRHANDIDINTPWISCYADEEETILVIEHSNPGMDCLQSYIDSLVELGRMNDTRLGKNFFTAWKLCACQGWNSNPRTNKPKQKKQKIIPKGSLSLYNCASASNQTFQSMYDANIGEILDVLDLTGVHALTDDLFTNLIAKSCPHIRRLSLKNCRQITGKSIHAVAKNLTKIQAIDIGGSFNVTPNDIIRLAKKTRRLKECYVSGLGWTDSLLYALMETFRDTNQSIIGLSVGFSPFLTSSGMMDAFKLCQNTLTRLGIHFCDASVDSNHMLAKLGALLPSLSVMDIRGCQSINSITPFMNARTGRNVDDDSVDNDFDSDDLPEDVGNIFILARYTNISKHSLEETYATFPGAVECVIDGGGIGRGIKR